MEQDFTFKQIRALRALEQAFRQCKRANIAFFVQENDLIAFADRVELVARVADHKYLRTGEHTDHADTIVDCGAWD